jgi:hypothetical protein
LAVFDGRRKTEEVDGGHNHFCRLEPHSQSQIEFPPANST